MADIFLGVFAIVAGLIFCFAGHLWLRVVFPVWGAFAGFAFGAGLVAGFGDDRFLGGLLGWLLGLVFAVLFALLAYSFYALAVIIAMSSLGFAIGSGVVVALGFDWNWVAVIVGVLAGALIGTAAILVDLPRVLLTLLSAVAGAVVVVAGCMLVLGAMDSADFTDGAFVEKLADDWWWYATFLALAIAAFVFETRDEAAMRRSLRASWTTPLSSPDAVDPF